MHNGSPGGIANAIKSRKEALDRYYANPNVCLYCQEIIQVKDNERIPWVRKKKFCNRSCAGFFNSPITYNIKGHEYIPEPKIKYCKQCGCGIALKRNEKGIYNKNVRLCDNCFGKGKKNIHKSGALTKEEVFSRYKNWQTARGFIRKHALYMYAQSGKLYRCACGYEEHVEICHKKPVSVWDDASLLSEINHIDNLMALCPNHHWELDNGIIIKD